MKTVGDVVAWLERLAPTRLAEAWDNVGLLCGDPQAPCERAMTCLTVTPTTAAEAVEKGAQLVVTHHPILFNGAKNLRADKPETAPVWTLARAGIAVYSPHTAFDSAKQGINALLARKLGLLEVEPLTPGEGEPQHKVVVFCARPERERVMRAAFEAGAGHIGAYSECSYSSPGVGTFFGDESTDPAIGEKGRHESVREWRVELLCPTAKLANVLAAVRTAHSYEEPAIDVYPLRIGPVGVGTGRVGRLPNPTDVPRLARQIGVALGCDAVQFVDVPGRRIERLAIACGAGDLLIPDALAREADALFTGEVRFHHALEAATRKLGLVVAGHHATERPGVEWLAERLRQEMVDLSVWPSVSERDPFTWLPISSQ